MFQAESVLEEDLAKLERFRNFLLYTQESRRMDPATHPKHSARNIPQLTNSDSAFQILQPPSCPLIRRLDAMHLCYGKLGCVFHLDFTDRQLNVEDAKYLAQFIPALRELRSLSLLGICVGREGVMALAEACKECAGLDTLDLVQAKYQFVVDHRELMKKLAAQGRDIAWWGATQTQAKGMLPPYIKLLM
jgi:hypothetical protein